MISKQGQGKNKQMFVVKMFNKKKYINILSDFKSDILFIMWITHILIILCRVRRPSISNTLYFCRIIVIQLEKYWKRKSAFRFLK